MKTGPVERAFPAVPGTYVVWLRVAEPLAVSVGRLGRWALAPGDYAYVGSARGPGGLRARLARHLRPTKTLHWHIDALTAIVPIAAIWLVVAVERLECQWAAVMLGTAGVTVPVPGFGASDCHCRAHLLSVSAPAREVLWEALGRPGVWERPPDATSWG